MKDRSQAFQNEKRDVVGPKFDSAPLCRIPENLYVRTDDGRMLPLFQSAEPELCELRRKYFQSITGLTDNQIEVLILEAFGLTKEQIGEEICLSPEGASDRINVAREKLGINAKEHSSFIIGFFGLIPMEEFVARKRLKKYKNKYEQQY